ncbi:hypothetical protein [Burkholderia vietnamiensis]|uniref:hypothetical protein n=1 Tax=Burkholderia vietnamiensis TaxID=60552 RepID=UPI0012D948F9|nr:hypothetical protein [Burkholderia vietnamiensis]
MSRLGPRRRSRGFAAGAEVGVDVDAARGARIASMAGAFVPARTPPATFRPTNWHVLDHARRARSRDPLANRSVGRIGRRRIRPESDRVK